MKILSIIKSDDLQIRGLSGQPFVRLDDNSVTISPTLCKELGLVVKVSTLSFCTVEHDGKELYAIIIDYKDGIVLKGSKDSMMVNSKVLAHQIAKHYKLETIIDPKGDFKHHRFDFELTQYEGKTVIILLPPKKYGE